MNGKGYMNSTKMIQLTCPGDNHFINIALSHCHAYFLKWAVSFSSSGSVDHVLFLTICPVFRALNVAQLLWVYTFQAISCGKMIKILNLAGLMISQTYFGADPRTVVIRAFFVGLNLGPNLQRDLMAPGLVVS